MGRYARVIGDFGRFLRSTPGPANVFAIATLAIWTAKAVIFDAVPEVFPHAYDVGKIFEGVLSAILAAWVFYLFFLLLPEFRERRLVAPYVLRQVTGIVTDCKVILQEIGKVAKTDLHFALCTHEQLDKALAGIPLDSSTVVMSDVRAKLSWLDFFKNRCERSRAAIEASMRLSRYLDPKLVAMILGVSENSFFGLARSLEGLPLKNMDLSVFAKPLFGYICLCRNLARWHDSHTDIIARPIMVGGRQVSASFGDE